MTLAPNGSIGFVTEAKKDDPPVRFRSWKTRVRRIVKMTPKQIAGLGRKLVAFLRLFSDCFGEVNLVSCCELM